MKATNKKMVQPSNEVVYVATDSLISNKKIQDIYLKPENFDFLKENISQMGILVPLLVEQDSNEIISGNTRHQIAIALGFDTVPVIYEASTEDEQKTAIAISTNQFRKKSSLEILREIRFIEEKFGITQGKRIDKNPELKKQKATRDKLLAFVSKDKQNQLKSIDKLASELYGKDTKEYINAFRSIDNETKSTNKLQKELSRKVRSKKQTITIPANYEYNSKDAVIHCGSSGDMSSVADNSIQTVISSPPYFGMFDYQTGKQQLGLESDVDTYINNLMVIFKETYRVLKDEGSLFVNINDCCIDGKYQAVPHKFVIKMMELGFTLNDEWTWFKSNARYTQGNRSVRNHEPIFHFVKTKNFYYDTTWMDNLVDDKNSISCGTRTGFPKILSGLDFVTSGFIKSSGSSTSDLRKKCAKVGFHLTHAATFPISIPAICILLSSKEGDTVLDCFNGTGTSGEASLILGRKYIGYETNPEYIMASEVRLNSIYSNAA